MSILGKIALGIAIAASLASAVFGFLIATEKTKYSKQLASADAALKGAPSPINYTGNFKNNTAEPAATIVKYNTEIKTAQENLSSTKKQLDDKEKALTESEVKRTQLTESETRAKEEAQKFKTELDDLKTSSAANTEKLKAIEASLQGNDPAQMISDIKKGKEDLKIAQDQLKTSEFENKTLVTEVERLRQLEKNRQDKSAPQDFTAKVVAINKPWNFVVLNAGTDKQLVEGVELMVYRGNQLIGKVRTVNVDNKTAVADVLSDWTKGEIQIGDQVLF